VRALFRQAIVAIYIFLMAPFLFVAISSVGDSAMLSFPPRSFTFHWYGQISPKLLDALRVSLLAATAAMTISSGLGLWIALAIARGHGAFASFLKTVSIAPLSVPHLAIGIALYQMVLLFWDFSGITLAGTFPGLVLGHSAIALPFVVRGVLAGHANVDPALERAALSLGASSWRALWTVTLPLIRPGLVSGAFLAFLASFDDVPIALFMGGGENSTTFPLQVLASLEFSLKPDIMAMSTLIVLASVIVMLALDYFFGLERFLHGQSAD
jgi:putative spermidine/putrescine transport system permease protein